MIQGKLVDSFCHANYLKLNVTKTEFVQFPKRKPDSLSGTSLQQGNTNIRKSKVPSYRCVVAIWSLSHQFCERMCLQNTACFLCSGLHWCLSRKVKSTHWASLFENFVVSTILYGWETWESHLSTLESFQAEIGKRILGLPKQHSNLSN